MAAAGGMVGAALVEALALGGEERETGGSLPSAQNDRQKSSRNALVRRGEGLKVLGPLSGGPVRGLGEGKN
jgi:hypothetical protein